MPPKIFLNGSHWTSGGIQFALQPMQLRINEINLSDFYARMILGADGRLNLQKLAAQKTQASGPEETKEAKPLESQAAAPSAEKQISIGKINLQAGNVYFSDFFVKPNYSANLTSVQGSISELKPDAPGDVAIQAKLDNAAPVDIQGKLNPLSKELYMDIAADAREIELDRRLPTRSSMSVTASREANSRSKSNTKWKTASWTRKIKLFSTS